MSATRVRTSLLICLFLGSALTLVSLLGDERAQLPAPRYGMGNRGEDVQDLAPGHDFPWANEEALTRRAGEGRESGTAAR